MLRRLILIFHAFFVSGTVRHLTLRLFCAVVSSSQVAPTQIISFSKHTIIKFDQCPACIHTHLHVRLRTQQGESSHIQHAGIQKPAGTLSRTIKLLCRALRWLRVRASSFAPLSHATALTKILAWKQQQHATTERVHHEALWGSRGCS